ncbi:SPOR domain-containing protein [Bacillus smithii]|uniref:SPOR domain-containing protein n=1 Tax=Bacillus smithii TaxID=1479 RepID=UPI0022E6C5B1|nr:SPOR domain-containing protein [Bacillus smithii]
MDEQKNRTIKIVLDGKESEKKNSITHRWNTSQKETAAAIEKNSGEENESFAWVLPEEEVQKMGEDQVFHKIEYVSTSKGKKKSGKRSVGGKQAASLALSIVSAMIVGIMLGFVIVKVVTNADAGTPVKQVRSSQQGTVTAKSNKEETLVLPELSASIVQGGIFSKEEAAQEVLKKVKDKGVPAETFMQDGQYVLLLGTAGSIEDAKKLGSLWKEKKVDVYAKTFTIPERKIQAAKSDTGLVEQYVSLFQLLSAESANIVLNKGADLANRDIIQSDLQKVEKQTPKTTALKTMQKSLLEAGKDITHLSKQADRQKGIDAQEQLLKFIGAYSSAK